MGPNRRVSVVWATVAAFVLVAVGTPMVASGGPIDCTTLKDIQKNVPITIEICPDPDIVFGFVPGGSPPFGLPSDISSLKDPFGIITPTDPMFYVGTVLITLPGGSRPPVVGYGSEDRPCNPWSGVHSLKPCDDDELSNFPVYQDADVNPDVIGEPMLCVVGAKISVDSETPDLHFSSDDGVFLQEPEGGEC